MNIINLIDTFAVDIYFKMPAEINNDYINICTSVSNFFDTNFQGKDEVLKQKNQLLNYLLEVMCSHDYIKMADALSYTVRPILVDADKQ